MKVAIVPLALLLGISTALGAEGEKIKVRFHVTGGYCAGCVSVLADSLVQGGVENASRIAPNRGKGHVIVLGEIAAKKDLAELAKTVVDADTPHKKLAPPAIALEVFTSVKDKEAAEKATKALSSLKGVNAKATTFDLETGAASVSLNGQAKLTVDEVLKALSSAGVDPKILTGPAPAPPAEEAKPEAK